MATKIEQHDLDNWVNTTNEKYPFSTSESSTSLATSGSPWFEPLENIISSNSSSSVTSPSDSNNFLLTENGYDNIFAFNENDKDFQLKTEDDDDQLVSFGAAMESMPATCKKQKKKAPRKRLTQNQKEAHNKIEKRYRININSKLAKLQQIIPWVASEQSTFEVADGNKRATSKTEEGDDAFANFPSTTPKLNKSMILEKAVDYILYLQNNEKLFEMEVHRLKSELGAVKKENQELKQLATGN